jgi:hypothetical protein
LEHVSLLHAGRIAVIACVSIGFALVAGGCVDNTVVPPQNDVDAALPTFDSGGEDVAVSDAGSDADASVIDSSIPDATIDAGKDAATAAPTQLGLVAGGSVSHSPSYTMTGTTGPATAPVLRSTHYQLVGGMAVTTQKN